MNLWNFFGIKKAKVNEEAERDSGLLTAERENELIDKIVGYVSKYRMEVPAIVALETFEPLSYIGGNLALIPLSVFSPLLELFGMRKPVDFALFIQKKENIERIIHKIEESISKSNI